MRESMKEDVSAQGCRKCGKCCEMLGSPPFLQRLGQQGIPIVRESLVAYHDMPEDIPAGLRWEYQGYMAAVRVGRAINRRDEKLPCFWWDVQTKVCRHYRYRPKVCQDFYCGESRKETGDASGNASQAELTR